MARSKKYSREFVRDVMDASLDFGVGIGMFCGLTLYCMICIATFFTIGRYFENDLMASQIAAGMTVLLMGVFYTVRGIHLRLYKMREKKYE